MSQNKIRFLSASCSHPVLVRSRYGGMWSSFTRIFFSYVMCHASKIKISLEYILSFSNYVATRIRNVDHHPHHHLISFDLHLNPMNRGICSIETNLIFIMFLSILNLTTTGNRAEGGWISLGGSILHHWFNLN